MTDPSSPKSRKLLDQLRDAIGLKHYSYSTEKTYVHWARRYILFHNKRHPVEMGAEEIGAFLTHLVKEGNVSSSTYNQALNALLFLYRNVLHIDLPVPLQALRAKRSEHLPTVLSKDEVMRVLSGMQGLHQLMAQLLYGCGLRLMNVCAFGSKTSISSNLRSSSGKGKARRIERPCCLPAWCSSLIIKSNLSETNISGILHKAMVPLNCLLRLPENIPTHLKNRAGNIFSHRNAFQPIPAAGLSAATIWTPVGCSEQSRRL
jgi:hypothetical protein